MILFDWIFGYFGFESVVWVSYFVHLFFYLLIRKTQAYLGIVFIINAKNKSVTIRDAKKVSFEGNHSNETFFSYDLIPIYKVSNGF